ncbi:hypothetical protein YC2023_088969 [Brassica napus]
MSYDDVEIEDMEWNEEIQAYTYPCPCGDLFQITKEDLRLGEEIANCPSCSLYITVIYNMEDFQNDTKNNNEPKSRQAVAVAMSCIIGWEIIGERQEGLFSFAKVLETMLEFEILMKQTDEKTLN